MPHELGDELEIAATFLIPRNGRLEITRIREPVRAYGAEVRQSERRAEVLTDVASRLTVEQLHAKAQSARNHCNLLWLDIDEAHLGRQPQLPQLGNDQQLAIGVIEVAIEHRSI